MGHLLAQGAREVLSPAIWTKGKDLEELWAPSCGDKGMMSSF